MNCEMCKKELRKYQVKPDEYLPHDHAYECRCGKILCDIHCYVVNPNTTHMHQIVECAECWDERITRQ